MEPNDFCTERHKYLDERLDVHDKRLEVHGEQLNRLNNSQTRTEVIVEQLCTKIETLVVAISESNQRLNNIILGCAGAMIMMLGGFVIWYIQTK